MFADRSKVEFMLHLIDICEQDPDLNDVVRYKTLVLKTKKNKGIKYLDDLYEYWMTGKEIKDKLEHDYQVNENEIKSLQKTMHEV